MHVWCPLRLPCTQLFGFWYQWLLCMMFTTWYTITTILITTSPVDGRFFSPFLILNLLLLSLYLYNKMMPRTTVYNDCFKIISCFFSLKVLLLYIHNKLMLSVNDDHHISLFSSFWLSGHYGRDISFLLFSFYFIITIIIYNDNFKLRHSWYQQYTSSSGSGVFVYCINWCLCSFQAR